jgi:hypothetical protein
MTFPQYRRIKSPNGPIFDSYHRIEKYERPDSFMITQASNVHPLSAYITKGFEVESRVLKLIAGSEKVTRKEFHQKVREVVINLNK